MKITIWGSRGSIATPGPSTLRYGGNSTCLEIRSAEGRVFIVDAGSGIRNLGKALMKDKHVSAIRFFITHPHWDHLSGFPFFEPAYSDRFEITFCSGPHAEGSLQKYLANQMAPPHYPVSFSHLKANFNFSCEYLRRINDHCPMGSLHCQAVPLSHPNGGFGFRFLEQDKTFVFLTDNELGFQHSGGLTRAQYVELCRGADLLLHDAQYTDEEYKLKCGWGHSTYREATDLAIDAGVKRLGLFHHDPDRSDDDLDRQSDYCRKYIQQSGSPVECFACSEGDMIEV